MEGVSHLTRVHAITLIEKLYRMRLRRLVRPGLLPKFSPKFYYAKRRFSVTSKYRHIYEVLNVDKIKN
jgi:hypothetical protein